MEVKHLQMRDYTLTALLLWGEVKKIFYDVCKLIYIIIYKIRGKTMRKDMQGRYEEWMMQIRSEEIMKDALINARNRWDGMPDYFEQNKVDLLRFHVLSSLFEVGVIDYEDIFTPEAKQIVEEVFLRIVDDVI